MKQTAVVFVTDRGFLVPSLVAALQVLSQPDVTAIADVIVILADLNEREVAEVRHAMDATGLHFLTMESKLFLPPETTFFKRSHVPTTTLARLALHEVLPDGYQNIVYLDGDVQITGSIAPLVRHKVKPGHVAASAEGFWIREGEIGRFWRKMKRYLANIGLRDTREYFNAGVMAFQLDTWRDIAPSAMEYYIRNPHNCRYHDQSALNVAFAGKVERLSPLYNFTSMYAHLDIGDELQPKIIHFTGKNKPWHYAGPPWNGRFIDIYRAFEAKYPQLANNFALNLIETKPRSASISTLYKRAILWPWRRFNQRARLRRFMKTGRFALPD